MARSAYIYLVWPKDSELAELVWTFTVKRDALHAIARSSYDPSELTMERRGGWCAKLDDADGVCRETYDIEKELLAEGLTGPFVVEYSRYGGDAVERLLADRVFTIGNQYTVESLSLNKGRRTLNLKFVGIAGEWPSAMFVVDRHHKMWLNAIA